MLEVLRRVADAGGRQPSYRMGPAHPGDPPEVVAKIDRAREELGWTPSHSLAEIIEDECRYRQLVPLAEAGVVKRESRGRIVVISASVGAGHDGAAREWAARLTEAGYRVEVHDFMQLLPGWIGAGFNRAYATILHRTPWLYTFSYRCSKLAPGARRVVCLLLAAFRGRVARLVPEDAVAVLSTYPLSSQVLGDLRRLGRLRVPAATFLTDFAAHPLWVSPRVDAHFTLHPSTAAEARALGGQGVRVTGALVPARFSRAPAGTKAEARVMFGLPVRGPLAILVAGSWGMGNVQRAAAEIAATGVAMPVVVCGRNEKLRARIEASGIGYALGWITDMPALLHAADVLVENAGGLSSLEAMACGLAVLSYRPIAGHGVANAARLDAAGVSTYVRDQSELGVALADLLEGDGCDRQRQCAAQLFSHDRIAVVSALTELGGALTPTPQRRKTRRTRRMLASGAAVTAAVALGTATADFAVAQAVHPVRPAPGSAYLVAHPDLDTKLTARLLSMLRDENASIAVDATFARRRPDAVRRLARDGFTIVNAGDGPPYSANLVDGFVDIWQTSRLIRHLSGQRPRFFLSMSQADIATAAAMAYQDEALLKPTVQLASPRAVQTGGRAVILVDCDGASDTVRTIAAIRRVQRRGKLRLIPLSTGV